MDQALQITGEQLAAAKSGQAVEIEADDTRFLLIRVDLLGDFPSLPPDVVTRVIEDAMQEYDAADPLLVSYQSYK